MNRESFRYAPSIVLGGSILLGIVLLTMLVIELQVVLAVLFLGLVLGIAFAPLADYLSRYRIPRPVSVLAVYALVAGVLALFLWYAIPRIAAEAETYIDESGELADQYEEFAEDTPLPALEDVQEFLADFAAGIDVAGQAFIVFDIGLYFVSILIIAIFFTISKDRAMDFTLSLVAEDQREQTAHVLDAMARKLRRYMLAQLISMAFVGLFTYLGLLILGVPFALILGVLAFILGILPVIGATITFAIAFLLALTEGLTIALMVAALYVAIESLESYVLIPIVQRSQTRMPELLILVAILVGGALMGILGALIALPATVVLYILVHDVIVPWRQSQLERREAGDEAEEAPAKPAEVS